MKQANVPFLLALGTCLLTSWNGSMVNSTTTEFSPDVNFYGTLMDHTAECSVENILIGGKYKEVVFYQDVPADLTKTEAVTLDPKQNKIFIDLKDVRSIKLKHPDKPTEFTIKINNRDYSVVTITTQTDQEQDYLVENSREVTCVKVTPSTSPDIKPLKEERKLQIIHVKNLTIKGYKTPDDKNSSSKNDDQISTKAQASHETSKILDSIEEQIKTLPDQDPSSYEKVKNSITSLLKSLREQLQKIINMIK